MSEFPNLYEKFRTCVPSAQARGTKKRGINQILFELFRIEDRSEIHQRVSKDFLRSGDGGALTEVLENLCKCDFLRNATFAHFTKAKEALHTVLITTYGLKRNLYSDRIDAVVTMENLFNQFTGMIET